MGDYCKPVSCLVVGNYCHDLLMKDGVVLGKSIGGAAAFISVVLDGVSVASNFVSKVGADFSYSVSHRPRVCPSSRTTLFHADFMSGVTRQDRILKRICACDPITPGDLPDSERFEFGLAVGVGGEILPETLEKMLDICDTVFVDAQALIRVFDSVDGTVCLVPLSDSGFQHLVPRIGFLKASSDEAPYIDLASTRKKCCVVITNGKDGCTIYSGDVEQTISPFLTVQVDPTGAGDSFLGGLVAGLAQGLPLPDAAMLGNFFGSLTVEQLGLPKFDSQLLQAIAEEISKKKSQSKSPESLDPQVLSATPSDHDDFRAALVRAGLLTSLPVQECRWESPAYHPVTENPNHLRCSSQP